MASFSELCSTYVIRRMDQNGGYVTEPGSAKSFAKTKRGARRFPSYEAAKAECCENETPEKL